MFVRGGDRERRCHTRDRCATFKYIEARRIDALGRVAARSGEPAREVDPHKPESHKPGRPLAARRREVHPAFPVEAEVGCRSTEYYSGLS